MRDVNAVLDAVKLTHKIGSDYKLAMYLGIGSGNLRNYRHGRSLPDPKACQKLAAAMGEKPDLLMVEIEAQRTKDGETRALWENLARRLQSGVSTVKMLLVVAMVSIAASALPALSATYAVSFFTRLSILYIVEYLTRKNFFKGFFVTTGKSVFFLHQRFKRLVFA